MKCSAGRLGDDNQPNGQVIYCGALSAAEDPRNKETLLGGSVIVLLIYRKVTAARLIAVDCAT